MKDHSCKVVSTFKTIIDDCVASYSSSKEERELFGKGLTGINSTDLTYDAWRFQEDPGSGSYSGSISTYPGNGYMINLGEYRDKSEAILADLKTNKWIDDKTRAIIVDFTVYNGNVNLFNQIRYNFLIYRISLVYVSYIQNLFVFSRLVMEFPSTGGVLNSWVVRTSKLLRYVADFDYFIAGAEVLFAMFIVYFTIEEFLDVILNKF